MKKERIDTLLVLKGLFESREKAKRSIMAGLILADGERIDKPGTKVSEEALLSVKGEEIPYVGRGGFKLAEAYEQFNFLLRDKIMLDIGASTGGFTDVALQNGAAKVYALDVGYNQLAWKLRQDERVIVMERTNFRYCTKEDFTEGMPDLATIDVSFISLKLLLPVLYKILSAEGDVIALIKPQFEAGKEEVGKNGIVRLPSVHEKVLEETIRFSESAGFTVLGLTDSPIRGSGGNIEFLVHLRKNNDRSSMFPAEKIAACVHDAHEKTVQ
ncbi:TlyA family RNA methyltransferase [Salisediminibacterium halotolerans]|uniref:TlyA family RNA methyltransferase n=1 Tax=Salisediminibacterium halotolerans TaxID=517425 RepID=UPI000EABE19B|nr:TlyA family RNA methyltransferase [Salisediminibacterium halotolerans]RLJ78069.1 23S rRNA (cytidine1920-2'-O)/16S rRNA (cytidine1409-2'-O)-methyltransferase [Actinophytocola xinjiangensis]RPE88593.1 23S rRNA (cytidine1920-2'-O)/16S rRNA (cytidine1409-2'-O)-methyltransferase [Salisediminibacterium halotolerans]TWG37046.1 23S rRNA (cytidine1920-2'-O)/16S rRNA (cytidine1409-2'-O)-methyltransferase [Salisediminibacterium halotolerans]GEL06900.1 TlyA family rRNA (cytidine-2'-O)-methyltransferase 